MDGISVNITYLSIKCYLETYMFLVVLFFPHFERKVIQTFSLPSNQEFFVVSLKTTYRINFS